MAWSILVSDVRGLGIGGVTQLEGGHQSTLRLTPDRRTLLNIFFTHNQDEIRFGSFH